jgi:hypothetical protein
VAIGLLTGINREIVQKLLKRFLRYAEPAPVGHGAHYARTRKAIDYTHKRGIYLVRRRDLVANEPVCVPKTSSKTPELARLRWITLVYPGEG